MASAKPRLPDFGAVWWILLLVLLMGFAVRFDAPFMPLLVETINGPDKAATWTGIIASMSAVTGIFAGPLLGWATGAKSCGWFLSSLARGAVAMHLGVRWVYFSAAVVFMALVPLTKLITSLLREHERSSSPADGAISSRQRGQTAHRDLQ